MSSTESGPGPSLRPIRPISRRSQRQITLIIAGLLVLLIGIRLFSTHPLPKPGHTSPEGAVAGYVDGLSHRDAGVIAEYLVPAQKERAGKLVQGLRRYRVTLEGPTLSEALEQGDRASVSIAAEICYQPGGRQTYTCDPLGHAPLGLPAELQCQKVGDSWYVTTLFEPD